MNNQPDSPPVSPSEDNDYIRLLQDSAAQALKVDTSVVRCSSPPLSRESSGDSHSSDGPYFDPESVEAEPKSLSLSVDFYDCDEVKEIVSEQSDLQSGHDYLLAIDSDSCSESLPNSQSTTTSLSTCTANSSSSNFTLQEEEPILVDLCLLSKRSFEENDLDIDQTDRNVVNAHHLDERDQSLIHGEVPPKIDENEKEQPSEYEPENSHHEEDEFKPERVRRCSSLKTGKTPPGTPGRKKFVRFADVLGLDLADVKTFMDEIPTIPKSAYEDLVVSEDITDEPVLQLGPAVDKVLVPLFQQPGGTAGFLDLVRTQNVCLENAMVTDPICLTISGTVRVRNLDFNKSVHLRYSLDSWHSYSDFQATYVEKSCDGFSDKFSFTVFGNSLQIGQRIEMAVRFSCKGDQYWDNNNDANYCFQCLPSTAVHRSPQQMSSPEVINPAAMNAEHSCSGTFY